jgi:hypothetical protein
MERKARKEGRGRCTVGLSPELFHASELCGAWKLVETAGLFTALV